MRHFTVPEGMARSVWENKYARKTEQGFQTWSERLSEVVNGNFLLDPRAREEFEPELAETLALAQAGVMPFSGRHLQHGDLRQPDKRIESFVNCATAMFSFIKFWLLLKGSGVGRCYDSDICRVNWDFMPNTRFVIDERHPDWERGIESLAEAKHKYDSESEEVRWFEVEDSGEGWVKVVEALETAAAQEKHANKLFIFDFSQVRCKGTPIKGQQGRPASGPVPFMQSLEKVTTIKGAGMKPWKQALFIDHYLSKCVAVGGIRRSARIATKSWRDKDVIEFIDIKRVESDLAKMYTANNSVSVDAEFWEQASQPKPSHARRVFEAAVGAAYFDKTGEPGFLNVDRLTNNETGLDRITVDNYLSQEMREKLELHDKTLELIDHTLRWAKKKLYKFIVNPCVVGDTWVTTAEGSFQVRDLINVPFTALVDGKGYKSSGFWSTGSKPVYRIKSSRGFELTATGNHKVLVEASKKQKYGGGYHIVREWIPVSKLSTNDKLVLGDNSSRVINIEKNRFDLGWIIGEVLGDGGHNPSKYPSYVRFWGPNRYKLGSIASSIAHKLPEIYSPTPFQGEHENKHNKTVQVSTRRIDNLVEGYIEPKTKRILPLLERADDSLVAGFLRGFFDSDGSIQGCPEKGHSVRLSQSDLERLKSTQRMLLRLGIVSTIYKERKPKGTSSLPNGKGGSKYYSTKSQHELVIAKSNIIRFREIIGFYDENKKKALDDIATNHYSESFTTKVISVEPAGSEEVFDCEIEATHRFAADGIIVHNCGEIVLSIMGGYCVIGDICLANVEDPQEALDAARLMPRFLMRVNRMPSLYASEVERTNRIGVGLTGIHEFAYKHFNLTFWDLLNQDKSFEFWAFISEMRRTVEQSAVNFSEVTNVAIPHTFTTMKPSGTISKVMDCTEAAHLVAMPYYIRWVQYALTDSAVQEHKDRGYPVKDISKQYADHCVIGFPTKMPIADIMGDDLTTTADVTPIDQYTWLRLLEMHWLGGDGKNNQVSYTLKYDPEAVNYYQFTEMVLENQPLVRACSVMPQVNESAYAYVPEEAISKERYEELVSKIDRFTNEGVDSARLDCESGSCPVEFDINAS